MVYIMGVALSDTYPAKIALTGIYGINRTLARRICARLQIHENAPLPSLTSQQSTALTAFLSAPGNAPMLPKLELAGPDFRPAFFTNLKMREQSRAPPLIEPTKVEGDVSGASTPVPIQQQKDARPKGLGDQLRGLRVETDLRRYLRDNIMHHRLVNTYIGRRHAMGLPVRGQRTSNNAMTAKRLNRLERRN